MRKERERGGDCDKDMFTSTGSQQEVRKFARRDCNITARGRREFRTMSMA